MTAATVAPVPPGALLCLSATALCCATTRSLILIAVLAKLHLMSDVTRILNAIERGDPHASEQLLPVVYDELRKLAAARMAQEAPGQTLQATALVHEAYLRLVGGDADQHWGSRAHFFAAAAEAMRRILIENARRKGRIKHGGGQKRIALERLSLASAAEPDELLILDDALSKLSREEPDAAQLIKLRFFAGMSVEEAAQTLRISRSSAYEHWTYARAWLQHEIYGKD
jgi:RNA polymerase sigma factor (TIGR02999 family)